jgi:hypothetical protein
MIADENGKFDQEMLAALTRLGFEIEDGGHSAYAECSVLIGDDMDFRIQMVTDNGGRATFRRVTREQILGVTGPPPAGAGGDTTAHKRRKQAARAKAKASRNPTSKQASEVRHG